MTLLTQNPDLAHHSLAHVRVLLLPLFKLFNGNDTACLLLLRLEDLAVGAFTNHLQDAEPIHLLQLLFCLLFLSVLANLPLSLSLESSSAADSDLYIWARSINQ